ncbi:MAG: hypothetical protein RIG62_20215 [Cyclobacteriaceae bacterium]
MNRKIIVKTLLCHIAILFFTIFLSARVISTFNGNIILEMIHSMVVTCLYIGSGYAIAKSETDRDYLSYFAVFFVGFTIWLIAFISSPGYVNWKLGADPIWLIYRLYVISYEPLLSRLISLDDVKVTIALLLILSSLPSIFTLVGMKIREIKTLPNKTQPSA